MLTKWVRLFLKRWYTQTFFTQNTIREFLHDGPLHFPWDDDKPLFVYSNSVDVWKNQVFYFAASVDELFDILAISKKIMRISRSAYTL